MGNNSKLCIAEWKRDINHRNYEKVVVESSTIAMLFYREKDSDWIEELETFNVWLENISSIRIAPHVKKYLMDLVEKEIATIEGKTTKKKLMEERHKTIERLSKAYVS